MDQNIDRGSVLIVEDDPGIADLIMESIGGLGLDVCHVTNGCDAIEFIHKISPVFMILDYSLSDMDAIALLDLLAESGEAIPPFIVTTGVGDEKIAVEMMKRGARDYVVKDSLFFEMLPAVIARVLKEVETEKQLNGMRESLKERDDLLRMIFEAATGMAFIIIDLTDPTHRIIEFSPGAEKIFGYTRSEVLGRSSSMLYPSTQHEEEGKRYFDGLPLDSKDEVKLEIQMVAKNSYFFPAILTSYPVFDQKGLLHARLDVVVDISERKKEEAERLKIENRIQHMQKLESLGLLAGGIAHDFNNLLMAILGNAGLAITKIQADSPIMKNLLEIEKASMRAGDLCNQMLAYAGKGKLITHTVNMADAIKDMSIMMEASISKKIRFIYDIKEEAAYVEADMSQIKQVVMNVVINSAEAIGEAQGIISIEVGKKWISDDDLNDLWLGDLSEPGEFVYLRVSDNGCGLPEAKRFRIFDPFYSTKFAGRGLGLAAVLGIVKAHKGVIGIESVPHRGTVFTIFFPAYTQKKEAGSVNSETLKSSEICSGLILVVDDEDTVRTVGKEMLEMMGYQVVAAPDGLTAVSIFREVNEQITCVLLDLAMPDMDGVEVYEEFKKINKLVPVLLSSGYSEHEIENRFKDSGYAGFIQKPYRVSELKIKLSKIINRLKM